VVRAFSTANSFYKEVRLWQCKGKLALKSYKIITTLLTASG
jgi:hypothetical protein